MAMVFAQSLPNLVRTGNGYTPGREGPVESPTYVT